MDTVGWKGTQQWSEFRIGDKQREYTGLSLTMLFLLMVQLLGDFCEVAIFLVFPLIYGKIRNLSMANPLKIAMSKEVLFILKISV